MSRNDKGFITIPEKVIKHISEIYYNNQLFQLLHKHDVKADTYCIHSDTENAENTKINKRTFFKWK